MASGCCENCQWCKLAGQTSSMHAYTYICVGPVSLYEYIVCAQAYMCVRGNPRVLSVQLWSAMVHYRLSHLDWGSILPKVFSSKRTEEDRQWEVKIRKVMITCLEVSYPFRCCADACAHTHTQHTHARTHARTHTHTHTHTHTCTCCQSMTVLYC